MEGSGSGNNNYAVDNSFGAYTRTSATVPFFGGSGESDAFARDGVNISLPDSWPQPSNISIVLPWHTQGLLDASADLNARGYARHIAYLQFWRGGELTAEKQISDIADAQGGEVGAAVRRNVDRDGPTTFNNISSPGNQTYYGLMADYGYSFASGGFINKARGTEQFFASDLHSWMDYQDWTYNLPGEFVIASC